MSFCQPKMSEWETFRKALDVSRMKSGAVALPLPYCAIRLCHANAVTRRHSIGQKKRKTTNFNRLSFPNINYLSAIIIRENIQVGKTLASIDFHECDVCRDTSPILHGILRARWLPSANNAPDEILEWCLSVREIDAITTRQHAND